jgi:hypothetical protein
MSMIFPGMDPYLEEPTYWVGVHDTLAVYIRDVLQPMLLPRYVASLEERVYIQGPSEHGIGPDVWIRRQQPVAQTGEASVGLIEAEAPVDLEFLDPEMHESFVNILDRRDGERVVTVIEILSPSNKYAGVGRDEYLRKQREIRASQANLVEIDLLRAGPHAVAVPGELAHSHGDFDYICCLNRAESRQRFGCYFRTVRQPLPVIGIPLANGDADVRIDVQAIVAHAYESGGYRYRLRYDQPCRPPLDPEDQAWADGLIRAAGVVQSNPQVSS